MGVTGLIKFVEKACEPGRIETLRGCTVAIDSFCLLHKGAYCCSDKIVQGVSTNAYVDYVMKYVKMLKSLRINVIMVFDGMANVSKANTEKKRKESRSEAKARGLKLLLSGRPDEAKKEFDKAVEINHTHALALMEACRSEDVDCITSMYEADAQLGYLNKIGLADYIISEDSDLILFGAKKIIFKLNLDRSCVIFDSSKLHLALGCSEEKFCFEKFRRIAILSGCDYLDSLSGIGLAKAAKFMKMTLETDMKRALLKIPSYLNMYKLKVTEEYIDGFLRAEAAFKYMHVYDPVKKKMVRLNELEKEEDEQLCPQIRRALDDQEAYQLALGNINPRTFEVVANFDPLKPVKRNQNQFKTEPHLSIWKCNVNEFKNFFKTKPLGNQQSKITNFVPLEKVDRKVREIIEQENNVEDGLELNDLLSQYGVTFTSSQVTSSSQADAKENDVTPTRKNPFAKPTSKERTLKAEDASLMNKVVNNPPKKVVSRFFPQLKYDPILPTEEMKQRAAKSLEEAKEELNARLEKNQKFYDIAKYSREKPKEVIVDNDVIMDASEGAREEETIVPKAKSSIIQVKPKLGLKRKSSSNISDTQNKFAKFGFSRVPKCN